MYRPWYTPSSESIQSMGTSWVLPKGSVTAATTWASLIGCRSLPSTVARTVTSWPGA